jgi:ectoine hydroxylase
VTTTVDPYPTRTATRAAPTHRHEPVVHGTPADGPLDAAALAAFDTDGFLRLDALLDPAETAACLAEVRALGTRTDLEGDPRVVTEPGTTAVRSVFDIHLLSERVAALIAAPRIAGVARQLLGSLVYVHQSRANYKPGFHGQSFTWHSDFETWHAEDGMPTMRALSLVIALTDNHPHNGPLMIMPGSHRTFVPCTGGTPSEHYRDSLKNQQIGVPDERTLTRLAAEHGIQQWTCAAGSALVFDCNCMHGSAGNISPDPRSNLFIVFNSVDNALVEPFAAPGHRPEFLASRDPRPVGT